MDWIVGGFLVAGFLFFWAVWVFGYWLPMAKAAQRDFKAQQAREQARGPSDATGPPADQPRIDPQSR